MLSNRIQAVINSSMFLYGFNHQWNLLTYFSRTLHRQISGTSFQLRTIGQGEDGRRISATLIAPKKTFSLLHTRTLSAFSLRIWDFRRRVCLRFATFLRPWRTRKSSDNGPALRPRSASHGSYFLGAVVVQLPLRTCPLLWRRVTTVTT
jgi:hypothetical protein